MSIFVLITGTLHKDPTPRTSQAGKEFVTANVRIEADGATTWASIIAFSESAREELLRLRAGDAVSVQGKAKLGTYEKNGEHHASLDVVAASVIGIQPKPKAKTEGSGERPSSTGR
ncbi:MAG: single-stranded DNA-binding protein [Methylococcaceae bacterium]|nr:single-stranded DNA-binding protein [Methylococcaceae bacterium]